ncbi:MAG TPA: hypothetical protein VN442_11805 [Bryobacteraceae bacterium]|nr:hypothetical protein [Bryobacteraceae bacterium]
MQRIRFGLRVLLSCAFLATCAASDVEDNFDYFVNNWNVVGLPDYFHGSRITPDNAMYVGAGTAVRIRVGRGLTALSRAQGKRAMNGWMPIIEVAAADGPVRYQITYWATPLPDVGDWQKAFSGPTEGENYLNWISVKATNASSEAAEAKVEMRPDPAGYEDKQALSGARKHTREYSWSWKLRPGESAEGVARYPYFALEDPARYDRADAKLWLQRTVDYWRGVMDRAAKIQVPCRKATNALLAAHVCQLIASDLGDLRGGEGLYDNFYIRDGAYQLQELEEAGLNEAAARAVDLFLPRQRRDGRFESQQNQFDANGQAIWALWQYAKITGDRGFLDRAYLRMLNAVKWTMRERRKASADSPFAGLLTAAPADGEYLWGGKNHIVGYDFWNLRGLLCTADAARVLGRTEDEKELRAEAAQYRAAIDAAWKRTGLPHFPPSWEKEGTHWGDTETLWPTPIVDRDDPRVAASIEHARKDFAGGFIEGTIQWRGTAFKDDAIHPYMGAYTVMASLIRGDDETVVQDFYWYLLHSTAAHAFPEGIFFKKRLAWSDTIPHGTGASNYAIMLRHMLVHEDGEDLHLLSAVPDWWLGDGQEIRLERLPTHFGLMDLTIRGKSKGVEVSLVSPKRNAPKRIVLHLPASRPLVGSIPGVTTVTRPDQKHRWDFRTIVEKYRSSLDPDERRKWEAMGL